MDTFLRICIITLMICIACSSECEAKSFHLHPVDSTAYSIKVALDSIVIPGSRKRKLVVTRKRAPGVPPEFHYELDTTGLIYVYRRNAREIVFRNYSVFGLKQNDNPYAVLRTQYGVIVFDKSLKNWVSVSPNTILVELDIGNCDALDGSYCTIIHGYPLPDDFWTKHFVTKEFIIEI